MTSQFEMWKREEQELRYIVDKYNEESDSGIYYPRTINDTIDISRSITLLIRCSILGLVDLVERCIKLGANLEDHDSYNRTALCWALIQHKTKTAEVLLKAGANPNARMMYNFCIKEVPIIFVIANNDNYHGVKLLLKYGAMVNEINTYKNNLCNSTLHYFRKIFGRRLWVTVKCATLILGLHKRAVITANHPDRLRLLGTFEQLEM